MNDGWLCDSILKAATHPSPVSMTPAFSPGPSTTRAPVVGNLRRWTRDDLYEQCSDHMTEKIPSSSMFGARPRICSMREYSSGESPCWAMTAGVMGCGCIAARLSRSERGERRGESGEGRAERGERRAERGEGRGER